jgi:hypothetical protein
VLRRVILFGHYEKIALVQYQQVVENSFYEQ